MAQSPTPFRLLVTGATGKQGGALIRALVHHHNQKTQYQNSTSQPQFHIFALTRKPTSTAAQALLSLLPPASLSSAPSVTITLLSGTLSTPESIATIFRTASAQKGYQHSPLPFANTNSSTNSNANSNPTSPLTAPHTPSPPPPFHTIFSVQTPLHGAAAEEAQGTNLAREAARWGTRHFVYTSAERGNSAPPGAGGEGEVREEGETREEETGVAHFDSKARIERALISICAETRRGRFPSSSSPPASSSSSASSPPPPANDAKDTKNALEAQATMGPMEPMEPMAYTILRPVAFMENLTDDFLGRAFAGLWRLNSLALSSSSSRNTGRPEVAAADRDGSRLQLISASDVGRIAAHVILRGPAKYGGRAIGLAGKEISFAEAEREFGDTVGQEMPRVGEWVARAVRWGFWEQVGEMFVWFREKGFGVDVRACRREWEREGVRLRGFREWLGEGSAWRGMVEEREQMNAEERGRGEGEAGWGGR